MSENASKAAMEAYLSSFFDGAGESLQPDKSLQPDNDVQSDNSSQPDQSLQLDDSPQLDNDIQADKSSRLDSSPQFDNSSEPAQSPEPSQSPEPRNKSQPSVNHRPASKGLDTSEDKPAPKQSLTRDLPEPTTALAPMPHSAPRQTRVPDLAQTEALRVEQKRRLQKLLSTSQAAQVDAASTSVQQLEKEIQEEFSEPLAEVSTESSPQAAAMTETMLSPSTDVQEIPKPPVHTPDTQLASQTVLDQTQDTKQGGGDRWCDNGRPSWAQSSFDALLFDVHGLTLAVPLISLGQIVRYSQDDLTPIFGQSKWFMGLVSSNIGQLRLVNTALFVMPEKYDAEFERSAQFAISLDGEQWALAVNRVNQPVRLDPSEIKWRTQRSKRPWLAGTVKSKMCALLDVSSLAHTFNACDASSPLH